MDSKVLKALIVVGLIVASIIIPYLYFKETRECLRGYEEEYMVPGWTQYIMVGKVMSPIFHPPKQSVRFVCEEWQEELR